VKIVQMVFKIKNKFIITVVHFLEVVGGPEKGRLVCVCSHTSYLELDVYLVTAFVPSLTACLASSPGRSRRTEVWISLLVMVLRLL
jgi:hypothetical protein